VSGSIRAEAGQNGSAVSTFIDRLHELFRRELKVDVPCAETDLLREGFLDSLQLIQLLLQLEAEFGMTISFEALAVEDFRSLRSIAELLVTGKGIAREGDAVRTAAALVRT
jgi:acyl carrier protein